MRAVILFLCGAVVLARAQQPETRAGLAAECRSILEEARSQGLAVGFAAVTAERGEVILRSQADRQFVPASNMKILTVAAALLALGPDHAMLTDLIAHGTREGEVLQGAVRLRGEGDPTLRAPAIPEVLAAKIRGEGIRRITGGVLVDDRLFDTVGHGPGWPKNAVTEEFMAEAAGLSLDHGTVTVVVSAGRAPGEPASVRVVPEGDGVRVVNRLVTCEARKDHVISVTRPPEENVLTVSGKVAVGTRDQEVPVAIHDPAMVFGYALARALERAGVVVDGGVRRPSAGEAVHGGELVVRLETKLAEVIPLLLKTSQNHRAESLWKHLGACVAGGGTFEGGAAAARRTLAGAGVDLDGAVLVDGSGLSRDNEVTANQIVKVLRVMWASPCRKLFVGSLPEGGEPGATLRHRLKDLGAKVHAKTGSLRGIASLSGYVESQGGATMAFSCLTRQEKPGKLSPRDVEDRLVRAMARLREAP